jgi:hypothetical protein
MSAAITHPHEAQIRHLRDLARSARDVSQTIRRDMPIKGAGWRFKDFPEGAVDAVAKILDMLGDLEKRLPRDGAAGVARVVSMGKPEALPKNYDNSRDYHHAVSAIRHAHQSIVSHYKCLAYITGENTRPPAWMRGLPPEFMPPIPPPIPAGLLDNLDKAADHLESLTNGHEQRLQENMPARPFPRIPPHTWDLVTMRALPKDLQDASNTAFYCAKAASEIHWILGEGSRPVPNDSVLTHLVKLVEDLRARRNDCRDAISPVTREIDRAKSANTPVHLGDIFAPNAHLAAIQYAEEVSAVVSRIADLDQWARCLVDPTRRRDAAVIQEFDALRRAFRAIKPPILRKLIASLQIEATAAAHNRAAAPGTADLPAGTGQKRAPVKRGLNDVLPIGYQRALLLAYYRIGAISEAKQRPLRLAVKEGIQAGADPENYKSAAQVLKNRDWLAAGRGAGRGRYLTREGLRMARRIDRIEKRHQRQPAKR